MCASSYSPSHCKVKVKYNVGLAEVAIIEDEDGIVKYVVKEPELSPELRDQLEELLSEALDLVPQDYTDHDLEEALLKVASAKGMLSSVKSNIGQLLYYIKRELGYKKLHVLLNDEYIEDISVCGEGCVWVRHSLVEEQEWLPTNIELSKHEVLDYIQLLALRSGESVTAAVPIKDFTLPEGHRVLAVRSEVSEETPGFNIRRRPNIQLFTIARLIRDGVLSPLQAAYLWLILENRGGVLIAGSPAAGKTTLLRALAYAFIPRTAKVVVVEDSPEVFPQPGRHWRQLHVRISSIVGTNVNVEFSDLVKAALRDSPDYLIIGEVRGEEARLLVQAFSMGRGGLATFHADDAKSALRRLMSPPISLTPLYLESIWCIAVVHRVRLNGKMVRRITEISEITVNGDRAEPHVVFRWNPASDVHEPMNAEDVIRNSIKMKVLMERLGVTADELRKIVSERALSLARLASSGSAIPLVAETKA